MTADRIESVGLDEPAGVVRAMWDGYREHGVEGALAFAAPDVRWRPHDRATDLCGHDAIRAYLAALDAGGARIELFPYVFEPVGSAVLVAGVLRIRDRSSWRDVPRWWLHDVDGGHIVALRGYGSREQALAAVSRRRRT